MINFGYAAQYTGPLKEVLPLMQEKAAEGKHWTAVDLKLAQGNLYEDAIITGWTLNPDTLEIAEKKQFEAAGLTPENKESILKFLQNLHGKFVRYFEPNPEYTPDGKDSKWRLTMENFAH